MIGEDIRRYTVMEEDEDLRLDVFLTEQITDLSRSYIQSLIKEQKTLVNGSVRKASYRLSQGERVEILIPPPQELTVRAQNIPLVIVYEDDDLAVVYKEKGMVVHPAPGNYENTLVNAILYHMKGKLSSINGVIRPGIVHRIDKDTSGLLMIAKTDRAHRGLSEQLKTHDIQREYTFFCHGLLKQTEFTVDAPIGRNPKDRLKMAIVPDGKPAVTHICQKMTCTGYTYAAATLETGRTHQIRVHMASQGHPLVGDELYGSSFRKIKTQGQLLHAGLLGFVHPISEKYLEFSYPEPEIFDTMRRYLENL